MKMTSPLKETYTRSSLIFIILISITNQSHTQDTSNTSFWNIKHSLQISYTDAKTGEVLGQYKYDSSNYFTQLYLHVQHWKLINETNTIELEAYVFIVIGRNSTYDTTGTYNFEVFTAIPSNGKLENRKIVATNCTKGQHTNGFIATIKLKPQERLYITNCSKDLLQEWEIGTVLNHRKTTANIRLGESLGRVGLAVK